MGFLFMKKCKKCFEIKEFNFFYKNKQQKDGYRNDCKECVKKRSLKWAINNKEKRKDYLYKYNKENYKEIKIKRKEYFKNWNLQNRKYYAEYRVSLRKNNPLEKIKHNLRNRTLAAFKCKNWIKGKGTELLLGGDYKKVKKHIEDLFSKEMNWDNYGLWHIDHIIPLSSAKTEKEMIELCNYKNLQPLWAKDNLSKGSKKTNPSN